MKLSELDPKEVIPVASASSGKLKLSDIHPSELTPVAPSDQDSSVGQEIGDLAKGAGQGLTLGFGDELLGGAQALGDVVMGKRQLSELAKAYREHQQENQKSWEDAKARSPWLTTGGELAGGMMLGGPLGLLGKGAEAASLGQQALKGAAIGAAAGIGGSKGTIESDPGEIAKDALFSSALGGAAPVALSGLGAAAGKVGQLAEDSPLAKKLGATWDLVKNRGYTFSGEKAGTDIENELANTSKSIASQFTNPMEDATKMYGNVLQTASDNGATISTGDERLMKALAEARSRYSGGLSPENEALLNKHGAPIFDSNTVTQKMQALNPREAKDLQLALRELSARPAYDSTTALSDAEKALTPAIRNALPEGELNQINNTFAASRKAAEPIINAGEIDPDFQKKDISDIDPSQLSGKMSDYISKLIRKSQDGNTQGDQARTKLANILENLKKTNELNQTQFADPEQIAAQVQKAGMVTGIRKGIYGDRAADSIGKIGGPLDFALGAPYRMVEGAARIAKGVEQSPVGDLARKLYTTSDEGLKAVAQQLDQNGLGHMGAALNQALENKSAAAKNAALFTIMQNPKSRQIITGSSDGNGQETGN